MKGIIFSLLATFILTTGAFAQHSLPLLPYKYTALEPYIDSVTMRIHHQNHHAAYVNNLNKALEKYPEWQSKSLIELQESIESLPADIQSAVRNNGGGHYNHSLFWELLAPAGTSKISKKTENALIKNFGSVNDFKEQFAKAATGRFGSGWAWLVQSPDGKLSILSTANQDNPLMKSVLGNVQPILALDVWEHAYYLKHQSRRAAYINDFWNVVNWDKVDKLLK